METFKLLLLCVYLKALDSLARLWAGKMLFKCHILPGKWPYLVTPNCSDWSPNQSAESVIVTLDQSAEDHDAPNFSVRLKSETVDGDSYDGDGDEPAASQAERPTKPRKSAITWSQTHLDKAALPESQHSWPHWNPFCVIYNILHEPKVKYL